MSTLLLLNGLEITATVEEQEELMLALAAGERLGADVVTWLQEHTKKVGSDSAV